MAECKVTFNGIDYSQGDFAKALQNGLLFNLINRNVINLPISTTSLGTDRKGFTQNFPTQMSDVFTAMKSIFKLPEAMAASIANMYERVAQSWAKRNNGTSEDFYKTVSIFNGNTEALAKNPGILYSEQEIAQIQREKDEVRTITEANGTFMKAPNGKKTNLTEDQWLTVQTPTFKNWFKNSKALDDNGEPKVYYHGTDAIWDEFDPSHNLTTAFKSGALFLSPDPEFAEGYIKTKEGRMIEFFSNAQNPFDYENKEHLEMLQAHDPSILADLTTEDLAGLTTEDNNWRVMEDAPMQAFLKLNGFDGFYVKEWGIKNLAIYDGNAAKVSDGTNQTFLTDNNNIFFQSMSTQEAIRRVTEGFKLEPQPKAFANAYKSKNEKASPELAQKMNDFLVGNLGVTSFRFKYEKTYGTVNAVPVRDKDTLFQDAHAAVEIANDGQVILYSLTNPNASSPMHELAHIWEKQLNDAERASVLEWAGHKEWSVETSEAFARGFEKYLAEGIAPTVPMNGLFAQFKEWLTDIYKGIVGSQIDVELNDSMRGVYAQMLGENFKADIQHVVASENIERGAPKQPDTMTRRIAEYVAPVVSDKQAKINEDLARANETDKHLRPIPENAPDRFGTIMEIQQAYRAGTYEDLVRQGAITEEQLRAIFESAGQGMNLVDNIMFKALDIGATFETDAFKSMDTSTQEFQRLSNYYLDSGRFEMEIEMDGLSAMDVSRILEATITMTPETLATKERLLAAAKKRLAEQTEATVVLVEKVAEEEAKIEVLLQEANEEVIPEEVEEVPVIIGGINVTEELAYTEERVNEMNQGLADSKAELEKRKDQLALEEIQIKISPTRSKVARNEWQDSVNEWEEHVAKSEETLKTYSERAETYREMVNEKQMTPVEETAPVVEEEDDKPVETGFKAGDKVSYDGQNLIVAKVFFDGDVKLVDAQGDVAAIVPHTKIGVAGFEKDTTDSYEPTAEQKKEFVDKTDAYTRIANRMQRIMPGIQYEIGFFKGNWAGRVKNGVVQINIPNASLDTPIHEFMHPFVLALSMSNTVLYDNLIKELRVGNNGKFNYYNEEVENDPNYNTLSVEEQEQEALVRFLAEDIRTVFMDNGRIDEAAVAAKGDILSKVYMWIKQIIDRILQRNREANGEPEVETTAQHATDLLRYEFHPKSGRLYGFQGTHKQKTDEASVILKTDLRFETDELTKRGFNQASIEHMRAEVDKFQKELGRPVKRGEKVEFMTASLPLPKPKKKETDVGIVRHNFKPLPTHHISVAELPDSMSLQEVAAFLIAQEGMTIDLSKEALAISRLNAYQHLGQKEANSILDKIKNKATRLKVEATEEIAGAATLTTEANKLNRLLRDYDGVEGLAEYVRQGINSLSLANQLLGRLKYDLQNQKGSLSEKEIQEMNGEVLQIRALIGMFNADDGTGVSYVMKTIKDEFDEDEILRFDRIIAGTQNHSKDIRNSIVDLTAEWLYPHIEIAQQGIPDDKKLTKEQFALRIRMADRDISSISYWLGATINSRDPLTAIMAVAIKDKLNQSQMGEIEKLNDIRSAYNKFLASSGVKNSPAAMEEYYKKNFLRKAKVWETVGVRQKEAGEKEGDTVNVNGKTGVIAKIHANGTAIINAYVERWAFHEEHLNDVFEDDFRKFTEALRRPVTDAEWTAYEAQRTAWFNANNPTFNPSKYRNPEFDRLRTNEYFQTLYGTYKAGNQKYGERSLKFGIVPQAYKQTGIISRAKEVAQSIPSRLNNFKPSQLTADGVMGGIVDSANYLLDAENYMSEQDLKLDGTYYMGVKSPFTHMIDQDRLDLRLNESVFGLYSAGNTFSALREVQANAENLKLILEGNDVLGIQARKVAEVDKTGKKLYERKWDKKMKTLSGGDAKANKQLVEFINDIFYGQDEIPSTFSVGKINVNLNAFGRRLGFVTALSNMAGNVFAMVSNVTIGNLMSLGEAVGGKYYSPDDWRKAQAQYFASSPQFLGDVTNPVKSKITQLGIMYDAIQGEFRDKFGKNITGNVASRYATGDTFFILSHVAEHQIQLSGMLALMNATKVKLKGGGEVSLYDAYEKNAQGFVKLRADAIWSSEQQNQFTKTLHGISKDLNGNYAAFDKGTIQRHWWGKLALQYRKYLYPAWRSRFSRERVDYERGGVLQGFYLTFGKKFAEDLREYKLNIFGLIASQARGLKNGAKGWTAEQSYAQRKTMFDVAIMVGTWMVALSLSAMEAGDDDDKDKWAKDALMLAMLRLRSDISQYSITLPQEFVRNIKNPSASLNTLTQWGEFAGQLFSPTEEYSTNSGSHKAGDSKLAARFEKIIPLYRQWNKLMNPDEQIKYYTLINKDVDKGKETKEDEILPPSTFTNNLNK